MLEVIYILFLEIKIWYVLESLFIVFRKIDLLLFSLLYEISFFFLNVRMSSMGWLGGFSGLGYFLFFVFVIL